MLLLGQFSNKLNNLALKGILIICKPLNESFQLISIPFIDDTNKEIIDIGVIEVIIIKHSHFQIIKLNFGLILLITQQDHIIRTNPHHIGLVPKSVYFVAFYVCVRFV